MRPTGMTMMAAPELAESASGGLAEADKGLFRFPGGKAAALIVQKETLGGQGIGWTRP